MPKRSDVPERDVIAACWAFHHFGAPSPDEAMADRFPAKVILARMDQMADRGLIEYGVSLRTAWPTDEGLALLAQRPDNQRPEPAAEGEQDASDDNRG